MGKPPEKEKKPENIRPPANGGKAASKMALLDQIINNVRELKREVDVMESDNYSSERPPRNTTLNSFRDKLRGIENSVYDLKYKEYQLEHMIKGVKARVRFIEQEIEAQMFERLQLECADLVHEL
eukprot:TRINITY_DN12568_c0_g1_i2.p1 TRINITY_DN12568_c0_g1~~TRINITY_DN12568_c0_g1_i2.p1  ORF type:complete len:125 (-),score=33.48 TRINITY_DN12568_c0_g1_i2:150-524(-)